MAKTDMEKNVKPISVIYNTNGSFLRSVDLRN